MDTQFFYGPRAGSEGDALIPPVGSVNAGKTGGFLFYSTTAVAYAAAAASSVPVLYNPTNSQFNCRIQWVKIGVRAGSWAQGDVGYGIYVNASLSALTAGPVALSSYVGGSGVLANPFLWYTTATSAVAPPVYIPSGINFGGAAAAGPAFNLVDNINGSIILAPGTAFYPNISVNAVAATVIVQVFVIATPFGA